jgi:hypothetical protein
MYEIYDDLLSDEHVKQLSEPLVEGAFPWHRQSQRWIKESDGDVDSTQWFSHHLISLEKYVSNWSSLAHFAAYRFAEETDWKEGVIVNCLAELTTKSCNLQTGIPKTDINEKVLIYYPIDCDGNTILWNEDGSIMAEIEPKAGRYLIFDGDIKHSAADPMESDARIILKYSLAFSCGL